MKNKELGRFVDELLKVKVVDSKWAWQPARFDGKGAVVKYWCTLNASSKKKIVKDLYWNNYPTYSQSTSKVTKVYGPVIRHLISSVCFSVGDSRIFKNHAEGLFAVVFFDSADSDTRKCMSKRMLKSNDKRCITRAIEAASQAELKSVLKKWNTSGTPKIKRYSRDKLIARIGFDNCYSYFIPSNISVRPLYIERRALRRATRKDLNSLILMLKDDLETISEYTISEVTKRLTADEIIFHLDVIRRVPQAEGYALSIMREASDG